MKNFHDSPPSPLTTYGFPWNSSVRPAPPRRPSITAPTRSTSAFADGTNARNFPGLNFDLAEARQGIDYAHRAGRRVFLAINAYPSALQWDKWCAAVDQAAGLRVDALILADPGLMQYRTAKHPQQRLHLSVQGSATNAEAIGSYARQFGVRRVVQPRVLSLTQVRAITARRCRGRGIRFRQPMRDGRGSLRVVVPCHRRVAQHERRVFAGLAVRWEETPNGRRSRLNGVLIDTYRDGEAAGYRTLCKGRFEAGGAYLLRHRGTDQPQRARYSAAAQERPAWPPSRSRDASAARRTSRT